MINLKKIKLYSINFDFFFSQVENIHKHVQIQPKSSSHRSVSLRRAASSHSKFLDCSKPNRPRDHGEHMALSGFGRRQIRMDSEHRSGVLKFLL